MPKLRLQHHVLLLAALAWILTASATSIPRYAVVSRYNPVRNASNTSTPMQVGNGFFAFGADVTGLQTFQPWATMSDWGWKNDSLPVGVTEEDILAYRGVAWDRVQYEFGGPAAPQQWLIANPNRANLGRVGLLFKDAEGEAMNVTEADLSDVHQQLDLWTGTITSSFSVEGQTVTVETFAAQSSSAVGIAVYSDLLAEGRLGLFLDFPWNDGSQKFQAPFVGYWNETASHTTTLYTGSGLGTNVQAEVNHTEVAATVFTSIGGGSAFSMSRDSLFAHRYSVVPSSSSSLFSVVVSYSLLPPAVMPTVAEIAEESIATWSEYWSSHGFVDLYTGSTDPRADELQRRIILSRYLMRVNEAGHTPPQESGLVNTGWYGKFHMEMFFWHSCHWALWNNWDLLNRSVDVYNRFLQTSIERAQVQEGYNYGARWSKMTDPSGRSAPGEINELLIWEQPHPLVFAEYEYRATGSRETLERWRDVVYETADWMATYAQFNESTGVYDLGPPMHVVSEDTSPNATRNPAFELSYWRLGLELAQTWMERLGVEPPAVWAEVADNLAPLPVEDGLYAVYEGIEFGFWTDPEYTNSHPALVGLYGWLPATANVSVDMAIDTAERVWTTWNVSNLWGWDFPMLAMSAARMGNQEKAIQWLLDPYFEFDDVGMPGGGAQVPTPYFPGSGGLLYAIAMMAAGWDNSTTPAPGFPSEGWVVRVEDIGQAM
ncbi:Six-hairpin glycosidase-like protein [Fomitopsis serialis]|uniref:Six-hairpin glycosidase-like protein n=1 Tax=Fomitopsis serialis TaxID=139415 RepID=UPI00200739A2|nr:Six-hairpin glycosidase-like protein [Neoantrodia serialis]KAH9925760.1 Six-hairpin glycosidase-like protein [Neoantrodia serialis]